jgi:FHS family L-fucose permease-like MFS transporter
MGHIADLNGMSAGFIIPLICFIWVTGYALLWGKLSGSTGVLGLAASKSH